MYPNPCSEYYWLKTTEKILLVMWHSTHIYISNPIFPEKLSIMKSHHFTSCQVLANSGFIPLPLLWFHLCFEWGVLYSARKFHLVTFTCLTPASHSFLNILLQLVLKAFLIVNMGPLYIPSDTQCEKYLTLKLLNFWGVCWTLHLSYITLSA